MCQKYESTPWASNLPLPIRTFNLPLVLEGGQVVPLTYPYCHNGTSLYLLITSMVTRALVGTSYFPLLSVGYLLVPLTDLYCQKGTKRGADTTRDVIIEPQ